DAKSQDRLRRPWYTTGTHQRELAPRYRARRRPYLAVWEQVPVQVEGHRRRLVPEHRLYDLHVGASSDRQGRRGVAQLVRVQSVESKGMRSGVEHATAEVTHPQRASPGRREHQIIPALASNVLRECVGKEPRNRYFPALVTFRCAVDQAAAYLSDALGDD